MGDLPRFDRITSTSSAFYSEGSEGRPTPPATTFEAPECIPAVSAAGMTSVCKTHAWVPCAHGRLSRTDGSPTDRFAIAHGWGLSALLESDGRRHADSAEPRSERLAVTATRTTTTGRWNKTYD
jgi:hypothetical protein